MHKVRRYQSNLPENEREGAHAEPFLDLHYDEETIEALDVKMLEKHFVPTQEQPAEE